MVTRRAFNTGLAAGLAATGLPLKTQAASYNGPNVVLLANGVVSGFTLNFGAGKRCTYDDFKGLTCG